jgi:hypothetical protein
MTPIDGDRPIGNRAVLVGSLLTGLWALSACVSATSMGDNISYTPPAREVAGPLVLEIPGDRGPVLQLIATDLRRGGFEIESQDPANGRLRAHSRRQNLVDCGALTQTARGTVARIDGAAPLAAIFDSSAVGGVLRREVRVVTEVTVQIGQGAAPVATLDEKQTITVRRLTADGDTLLSSQTLEAVKGGTMAFSDGTVCTSSGSLADMFR